MIYGKKNSLCLHHKYWTWFYDKIFLKYHNMSPPSPWDKLYKTPQHSVPSGRQLRRDSELTTGTPKSLSRLKYHLLQEHAGEQAFHVLQETQKSQLGNWTFKGDVTHFVFINFFLGTIHFACFSPLSQFLSHLLAPNNKKKKCQNKSKRNKKSTETPEFVLCGPAAPGVAMSWSVLTNAARVHRPKPDFPEIPFISSYRWQLETLRKGQ